jgi:crotonobetainyl-CoA:carnitine CoA-transferase CaiB-like acyl-CoA transferase
VIVLTQASPAASAAPLAGITVIELGHSVAAPFAGQILADLGAEVIKIEKAAGDDARHWGRPFWMARPPPSRASTGASARGSWTCATPIAWRSFTH